MERTFVMVKPDGVQRGLVGEIIGRFEKRGLKLVGLKLVRPPRSLVESHYAEHRGKEFFPDLVDHLCSGPVVAMVLEAENAVSLARCMVGVTRPAEAAPGTIRGDYGVSVTCNVVHAADSRESAEREAGTFFGPAELVAYGLAMERWVSGAGG